MYPAIKFMQVHSKIMQQTEISNNLISKICGTSIHFNYKASTILNKGMRMMYKTVLVHTSEANVHYYL